ncbi:hypothetical protein T4A_13267 [Trichinella pseudospiralis]|uniref:Uncharacterized protein n=1 Tax=Trichinella pseudospiralis TaxID=6337 RepID=A0A0V1F211_TRIPS|nr:hypothetical protein T4A_13267 [Trichinella pseudospiralis]
MDVIYLFHSYFRDSNFAVNDVEFKLTYQKDAFDTEIVAGKATILVSQKDKSLHVLTFISETQDFRTLIEFKSINYIMGTYVSVTTDGNCPDENFIARAFFLCERHKLIRHQNNAQEFGE